MRSELCVRSLTGVAERESVAKAFQAKTGLNAGHQAVAREDRDQSDRDAELWLYRDRCIALLKRYVRLAVEIGRLPSLLGREFFRGRVTSYTASTFEESVIFVYDMEHSLEKLDSFGQELIAKIVLEEYSQREAAKLLNCPLRTVERFFPEALDQLSEILLAGEILMPLQGSSRVRQKSCQGGPNAETGARCCIHGE